MNIKRYQIYCDESHHLENDHSPVMVIGYIKVEEEQYERIRKDLEAIKLRHHTPVEIKWSKVSASRQALYAELIAYFFANPLWFRCVLVKYKDKLDHDQFNGGSHDNFYYKLVYFLLRPNHDQDCCYRVFLDVKDTRGREKLRKIREVFHNHHQGNSPFETFQHLRSHDSPMLELTDLFIGAIAYKAFGNHEKPEANPAKVALIQQIEQLSGYFLHLGTEPWEQKFNIFDHQPKRSSNG